jgi:hypothetical protein
MLSCLRTGDEESARLCLDRLTERFGSQNERLMALRGLYQEATAQNDATLKEVLAEYEKILKNDPSNMVSFPQLVFWPLLMKSARIETPNCPLEVSKQDQRSYHSSE